MSYYIFKLLCFFCVSYAVSAQKQDIFDKGASPRLLQMVSPGEYSRRALTEKITCEISQNTCYEVSGVLGLGCYSDPADLGIDSSFATNTAGSPPGMGTFGFTYTSESLCKQACDASPLCGGFYFAAQNGFTCKFQSIEQALSQQCLEHNGINDCSEIPASGSQCWWNDEFPADCIEHYADVNNQEHMHWICSKLSEPSSASEPVCSNLELITGTTVAPGNLATKDNLVEVCGSSCASSLGLSQWSVCGLSDGQIDGPGHGGAIEDSQQVGYDCWVQCKTEPEPTCHSLELVSDTTVAPENLASQANLVDSCGESCAESLGLSDWEVCGLKDGQLDGPLHGGDIEDSQQSGYDCWVQCKAETSPEILDLNFEYVPLGNGDDGFCRDNAGRMKFLGDENFSSEDQCRERCNQIFACAGYQFGRSNYAQDCNLYYAADKVSTHTNTHASCRQKQGQLEHDGYVWRGRGYCRNATGLRIQLTSILGVDNEVACRKECDEHTNCGGFAFGTPQNSKKCNLYIEAEKSSGSGGLGGCWAKLN